MHQCVYEATVTSKLIVKNYTRMNAADTQTHAHIHAPTDMQMGIMQTTLTHLLHVIPVSDNAVLDGVLQGEDTSLALGLVTDV